jgi:DNA-3-methyladenine glycosylase II
MLLSLSPCDAQPPAQTLPEAALIVKTKSDPTNSSIAKTARTIVKNARATKKFQAVATKPRRPSSVITTARTSLQVIETEADIHVGIMALRRSCDGIRKMHDLAGDPPLRRQPAGFGGLARIIIGQQVSVASAAAIWTRFQAAVVPLAPASILAMSDDDMRAAGLSRPKVKTFRAVATAIATGLDLDGLGTIDQAEAHAALTAISGIGPWTADVYLMFCVGHADIFAPGDLALQVAAQLAFDLDARPSAADLNDLAASRWQPYRAVAARLLWHYYAATKAPKSGQPV